MAINAYAGVRAQSISATVTTQGTKTPQTIYLNDKIGQLRPMMRTPNILDLISNNNFENGESSELTNLRFYWNQKTGDFDLLADETGTVKAGETILATETPVFAKQVFPISYGKKLKGSKRDLEMQGLENVISIKIADTILDFRNKVLQALLKKANNSAIATQTLVATEEAAATTFAKGAHYVQANYASADEIYKDLKNAISEFLRMGMDSASTKYNKEIQYMYGCTKSDLLILIDEKIAGDLFQMPGLWSSDNAFTQLFKNGEFKDFLGVPIMPTPWLPAGTNFMIMSIGSPFGALHYSLCGQLIKSFSSENRNAIGTNVIVKDNPAWSFDYMVDFMESYRADVLLPDLIWVSSINSATPITKKTNSFNVSKKEIEDLEMQKTLLEQTIEEQKAIIAKNEKSLKSDLELERKNEKVLEKEISKTNKIIDNKQKEIEKLEKLITRKEKQ